MPHPATAVAVPRKHRGLDEAIHAIPVAWFRPVPVVYWFDLLGSAALAWIALVLAVVTDGWQRAGLLVVAIAALYRAVLFIHEITHRAGRELPAFRLAWNALVGVPLLVPSFLYEGVHTDHHRQSCYGTPADPEYVPFGKRSPLLMLAALAGSLLAPVALAVRFGILAPISWAIPAVRRLVVGRCSALVINHQYVRRTRLETAGRVQEAAACLMFWMSAGLWWSGRLPTAALWCWGIASAAVSGVNAIRTLAAHRYDRDSGEVSMTDQLLDSCTIAAEGHLSARVANACRVLIAPVGLRYHALHHWIPSLPYHNLGRAHRVLVSTLRSDAPYHATVERGFVPPLRDLLRRSRTAARQGSARQ
ncbi:MAG: fatty acid desaturase [Acidobacteriota bacterium]